MWDGQRKETVVGNKHTAHEGWWRGLDGLAGYFLGRCHSPLHEVLVPRVLLFRGGMHEGKQAPGRKGGDYCLQGISEVRISTWRSRVDCLLHDGIFILHAR